MSSISSNDPNGHLLTVGEIAERLGVSRRTVERKIAAGEIPALRLGGRRSPLRIDEAEFERWLYAEPGEPA